jgi:hypothetical protein
MLYLSACGMTLLTTISSNSLQHIQVFKSNCKLSIKSNYQTMPDMTVTCEGIAKLLNLSPNKAAGPDDFCKT